jgi:hypothetical protein
VARGSLRYPTDNPQFALQSALMDRGINPFRANPYMGLLMGRAPGLAQAFMLSNLNTSAGDMEAGGGEGGMFGSYLSNLLDHPGGMTSALGNAARMLPGALGQITAMQDALAQSGGSFQGTNPFAYALSQIYDDPQGSAGAYGALLSPFMSRGVGQAFQTGLGQVAGMGQRRLAEDVGRGGEVKNFWDYLFPNL